MNLNHMKTALHLAARGKGRTSPNPMVGAVIVKNGAIVGSGYHHKAGTPHAEIHALQEAGNQTSGADLYVTLEPCCHTGRTPPCTEAIVRSGIKRVFIATLDPNPLVAGKGAQALTAAGIEIRTGIMEDEARQLNEVFFKYIRTKTPFIALKAATSLDGKIADATGESKWITSDVARLHGHGLRDTYDAILVGVGTVIADNPSLTCRLPDGRGRDPARIIVDSRLSLDEKCRVLQQDSPAPTIIATTAAAPPDKMKRIEKLARLVVVNDAPPVDLPLLLKGLGEMEITSVLVEGGSRINGSFLRQNLIDKFYIYIAPKIIGDHKAPGPFHPCADIPLGQAAELTNLEITRLDRDLLVTGYPMAKEG